MAGNIIYLVKPGDCITSIAFQHGFRWDTIWNWPDNAELKNARKNPNVLLPGDKVVIPEKRVTYYPASTDARHRYKRSGTITNFRMRLLANGHPRANLSYTCALGNQVVTGTTDSDGVLNLQIPANIRSGLLRIDGETLVEEYDLAFGQLNPVADITGLQQRLHNMGYGCDVTGTLDEQTDAAISSFRADSDLEESADLDTVRGALVDAHGS